MPIFEYHCNDCEADFAEIVAQGEEAERCRCCLSKNIAKKFSCFATRIEGATRSDSSASSGCSTCSSHSCSTCGH
ncbi:zinc ribbon domain-containing protein [bacterium]|nr:zinc ribbon domain-containing protein [bacterium]